MLRTDIITVMASGELPMFHFWWTNDNNGTLARFSLIYLLISEFQDGNGDGVFQSNESLYHAPLAAYEWTLQTGSVVENGVTKEVWLKYIKGGARTDGMMPGAPMGTMHGSGSVERFKDVTIQIWAHIYLYDYAGNVTDDQGVKASYLVQGTSELKMDVEIGNFPFSSESSLVNLQTLLRENEAMGPGHHEYMFETRERFRNATGTSNDNWTTVGGNETRFEPRNGTCIQRIDLVTSPTEIPEGFFSWVDLARITWPGGETEAVNVSVSYVPTGMGLAVNFAYPNFDGGSLLHDPSIGLYESRYVPVIPFSPYVVLGIGFGVVLALVVIALRVRRR
jgi:hypothetical protein